jgi:beta-glucanase (GH16 family)
MTATDSARAGRAQPPRATARGARDGHAAPRAVAAPLALVAALAACSPGALGDASDAAPSAVDDARPTPGPADAARPDADSPDARPHSPWRLSFQDEFFGALGAPPDSTRWTHETGGTGWGNNELEFYTDRPDNASLDGAGHLRIVARREGFGGRDYTSARLVTRGQFAQAYGRFEVRLRLPTGRGVWPAFWMLGANIDDVGWPECGEIDVMEHKGQEPRILYGSLHGPGYSGDASLTGTRVAQTDLPADFHVYAVEWSPGQITWALDGEVYHEQSASEVAASGRWIFDHAFFLILNVAVGGDFVGPPDDAVFPQTMLVDYVRAYEPAPQ